MIKTLLFVFGLCCLANQADSSNKCIRIINNQPTFYNCELIL